jgi:hypothetical protein
LVDVPAIMATRVTDGVSYVVDRLLEEQRRGDQAGRGQRHDGEAEQHLGPIGTEAPGCPSKYVGGRLAVESVFNR